MHHYNSTQYCNTKIRAVLTGWLTVSGFDVAWFSYLPSASASSVLMVLYTLWFKKNAPTLADYDYDPVQSILIIFSKLFVNDHKRCLVSK